MSNFKFLDFCAGIGGGRLGLENNGGQSLGFSEIDTHAITTYKTFYGNNETELGDLTKIETNALPDADLIIAGFPCQSYSINGKRLGFEDVRGQIIFHLANILKAQKTKYFILENVKGLTNINKGQNFKAIIKLLDEAGYNVSTQVLNSLDYGLPHSRERIYFVGIRKDLNTTKYTFPPCNLLPPDIKDYLIDEDTRYIFDKMDTLTKYLNNKYNLGHYKLEDLLKENYLVIDTRQSDIRFYRGYIPTLRTGRSGLLYVRDGVLRILSGRESLLFQGFGKKYFDKAINIKDTYLLRQTGNAMSINVISAITKELLPIIKDNKE